MAQRTLCGQGPGSPNPSIRRPLRLISDAMPAPDQIAVDRNRSPRFTDRVILVATMEFERIYAFDRNRIAVPIKRDPL